MSSVAVKRIFWKEVRTQRSFWIGVLGLAVGLQIFVLVFTALVRNHAIADPGFWIAQIAIVLSCCFATGSAAIAFAGEAEARSKGLLQRLPVSSGQLLFGKLSVAVLGSYLLFGLLCLTGGLVDALQAAHGNPAADWWRPNRGFSDLRDYALGPVVFAAVVTLVSLASSDVLLTVVCGGLLAGILLAMPGLGTNPLYQAAIFGAALLVDWAVAPRWLGDAAVLRWPAFMSRTGRPEMPARRRTNLNEALRSPVGWRRSTESLLWKEWRQAFRSCVSLFAVGIVALIAAWMLDHLATSYKGIGHLPLVVVLFMPLVLGVAAVRADRKAGAYQLLAQRGVVAEGYWLSKHAVWLSLTAISSFVLLALDCWFLAPWPNRGEAGSLWVAAQEVTNLTFHLGPAAANWIAPAWPTIEIAGLHVVLLYALGFFLASVIPGALLACLAGFIAWIGLAFWWGAIGSCGIPIWWTIGAAPFILLAASLARTGDWLVSRNGFFAWAKVGGSLAVPFLAVFIAVSLFRIYEIPAVAVPNYIASEALNTARKYDNRSDSLFVEAVKKITPLRQVEAKERRQYVSDGWKFATPTEKESVAANEPALKLALEAAKRPPGRFPEYDPSRSAESNRAILGPKDAFMRLTTLLDYAARKFESEDRLDEALDCYLAIARLNDDLRRSLTGGIDYYYSGYGRTALIYLEAWAAHPKQTTERVVRAIRQFDKLDRDAPRNSVYIARAWERGRQLLRQAIWHSPKPEPADRTVSEMWFMRWCFPWELVRLERLVDLNFAISLRNAEALESEIRRKAFVDVNQVRARNLEIRALERLVDTTLQPPFSAFVSE